MNVFSKVSKLLILILSPINIFFELDYHSRACASSELFSVFNYKMFDMKMFRDKSSEVLHTKLQSIVMVHLQSSKEVKHGFPWPTMSEWDM
jgi:hypothetical protein